VIEHHPQEDRGLGDRGRELLTDNFLPNSSQEQGDYPALLRLLDLFGRHKTIDELLRDLPHLKTIVNCDFLNLFLYRAGAHSPHVHRWRDTGLQEIPEQLAGGPLTSWVFEKQRPLVLREGMEPMGFSELEDLRRHGIHSYCLFPLTTLREKLGVLAFGSGDASAYSNDEIDFLSDVARGMALAVENVQARQEPAQEAGRLQALLDMTTAIISRLNVNQSIAEISSAIGRIVSCECGSVALLSNGKSVQLHPLDFPLSKQILEADVIIPLDEYPSRSVFVTKTTKCFDHAELASLPWKLPARMLEAGIRSWCSVPLMHGEEAFGTLNLGSVHDRPGFQQHIAGLDRIARQLAISLQTVRAYRSSLDTRQKLRTEKQYLEQEISSELGFGEIIGKSATLLETLADTRKAAATNATILILGETGTGKELVARAVHRMSERANNSFIKLNCAAIPSGLLESELFGHEKGAFTGAVSPKLGRVELADKGTLFLDEVGDIPLELQPKLLRALEDQEFERLGSNRTIHVDVRLIAATNRDLLAAVNDREFRSDLYYRLNVFPIHMPPLRERRDDIPMLASHFVERFARKMDKKIETISAETMNALVEWHWPGNVRELENFIERSVILTQGSTLRAPLAELAIVDPAETLADIKRESILRVLRETRGVIAGPHGAAARLGVKRTTLQSMIQRYKIEKSEYQG
jgi:formate hydrogenlyase transcriptional activator